MNSIVSRHQPAQHMKDTPQQQPSFAKDSLSSDKINQAFQNLFGNTSSFAPSIMQTPSFQYDNKFQIKAKPCMFDQETPQRQSKKISSLFSPIPCKPHTQSNIFSKADKGGLPYTPYNRLDRMTPNRKHSPITNTIKSLKPVAQNSRTSKASNKNGTKITPG